MIVSHKTHISSVTDFNYFMMLKLRPVRQTLIDFHVLTKKREHKSEKVFVFLPNLYASIFSS